MRTSVVFLFAACVLCAGPVPVLHYTFTASVTPAGTGLHVTLNARGVPNEVEQPTTWAGETLHGVRNLRKRFIADRLWLEYDLVQDWSGPLHHPLEFHGVLGPEYFEINGWNALVRPKLHPQTRVRVTFEWRNLPEAWALATSFGAGTRQQSYSGPWQNVQNALFTAGDFRLRRFEVSQHPVVLATRGQWPFTDDDAVAELQAAIGLVRDFWHDEDFPYFLVTLKPFDSDHGESDGTALTNGFWLYLSRLDLLSRQFPHVLHEAFHAWNPDRIGTLDEDDKSVEWFQEGFTHYYAYLLAHRAGRLTLASYVDGLNRNLRATSMDAYVRGRLIALWLDDRTRTDSKGEHSLDDLMRAMVHQSGQPLTSERIVATAGRYLSAESVTQLRAVVSQGGIPPAPVRLNSCARGAIEKIFLFDLGFDFPKSRDSHLVAGVVPNGPAFQAGLRNGQPLLASSFYNGDPDKPARFTVTDAAGRQTIEYYPRGESIERLQYRIEDQTGCRAM